MKYIFLLFLFIAFSASAQEPNASETTQVPVKILTPDFSDLKHTKSGRVDKVIDGLTFILKDKTILRLASLDIPDFAIWRNAPYSEDALKLLQETLPEGTEVMVYQTVTAKKGRLNRMNHELAHIVTKQEPVWLNGALLAHGLARVMIAPNAPEMVEQMLLTEQEARKNKRGIWSDESDYKVLTPETAEKAMGEFAIIEGRIENAASVRNDIYLNFGKDWKKDFTIMIKPTMRKELSHRRINPLSLQGQVVRIRGWLRDYNGPLIELDVPEHMELITPEKPQDG